MAEAANATLIHTGAVPPTLGSYVTIPNPPRGEVLRKRQKHLYKVHMDIVFGDCVALGGFRYALLLVDVATRYCWIYGMTGVNSSDIIGALEESDFDRKLMGGKALKCSQEQE